MTAPRTLHAPCGYRGSACDTPATHEVRLVATQPDGREALLVRVSERWVLLTWDPRVARVVTFLPLASQFTEDGYPVMPGHEPAAWRDEIEARRAACG